MSARENEARSISVDCSGRAFLEGRKYIYVAYFVRKRRLFMALVPTILSRQKCMMNVVAIQESFRFSLAVAIRVFRHFVQEYM